jgi:hypothetical protein
MVLIREEMRRSVDCRMKVINFVDFVALVTS